MERSQRRADGADDPLARFGERVEAVQRAAEAALEQGVQLPVHREAKDDGQVNEELLVALEELRVAEVELRQQNEQLEEAMYALEAERLRYRELFDSAPDGYIVTDADGQILEANRAALELLGVEPQLIGKKPLGTFVPGEDRTVFRERLAGLAAARHPGHWDMTIRPRRRAHFDASVVAAPVFDENARLTSIRWLIHDISERRRIEDHTRALNAELEQRVASRTSQLELANRAKTDFLATMSHELRTPLNAILGYAELLELGLAHPLTEAQRSFIERIQASGRHLVGLVDEVLDLAKVESGTLVTQHDTARASEAVRAAVSMVRPQAVAAGLRVVERCEGEQDAVYVGDEHRVRQILVNLLANAIKFTETGGRVHIECGVSTDGPPEVASTAARRWVFIRVRDTGIGIPQDKLADVFEPFVQAESGPTRTRGGTGLGLAIGRRLARLMSGNLTAESSEGKGSTFTLWLPAGDAADIEAAIGNGESPVESSGDSSRVLPSVRYSGARLVEDIDRIVERVTARMCADPLIPRAATISRRLLEDHFHTYLMDVGRSLEMLETPMGEAREFLRDGSEIQRLISERHGVQRHRLGWSEEALRREFDIIRQVTLEHVREVAGPTPDVSDAEVLGVIGVMIDLGERVSVRSYRLAASSEIR